jgi:hypothetical protein
MSNDGKMQLFIELQKIEQKGITLWLEGLPSNSLGIADAIFVNEECSYMRDYIYDEGVLKELRFDRVSFN